MDETTPPIPVPPALAATLDRFFGPAWARDLPRLAARQCDRWGLRPTGAPMHGAVALVVPVERADGSPAVLKVQPVDEETEGEPVALRAWNGDGAVRLLDHDPGTGAMLLEALDPARRLDSVPLDEALGVIGSLLGRLGARSGPPGMRDLGTMALRMARNAEAVVGSERVQARTRARLGRWAGLARELATEPGDRLLHWDLHYGNVLAPLPGSDRGPWLAIDPKPLVGDAGFELLPALRNRWEEAEATGDAVRETRRRFDLLAEVAGLDRERARAWTLVRVLEDSLWEIEGGAAEMSGFQAAVARALDT
ncbi:aminoglycoside phosphotransferase family protein [Nocardiopsis sp. L17-MgMaSL7]|uniref:aminoglycoside phosphotransferase family protein n=1 Tax=Nocardiopsis sp. L17-MgMaSL7 TaxID=1938893 RepID=UPI000D713594|nr:aminoglycoside phosphotransferase family protein [Nocardiopsis sp. L17-MgMaSL7]PWV55160.1 streptomycin 6-kinase [Nocardiopsis sp. L17-MgMaSL7]